MKKKRFVKIAICLFIISISFILTGCKSNVLDKLFDEIGKDDANLTTEISSVNIPLVNITVKLEQDASNVKALYRMSSLMSTEVTEEVMYMEQTDVGICTYTYSENQWYKEYITGTSASALDMYGITSSLEEIDNFTSKDFKLKDGEYILTKKGKEKLDANTLSVLELKLTDITIKVSDNQDIYTIMASVEMSGISFTLKIKCSHFGSTIVTLPDAILVTS